MQSNLYVHTKYENMEETYLYPIWEFFGFTAFGFPSITALLKKLDQLSRRAFVALAFLYFFHFFSHFSLFISFYYLDLQNI